MINYGERLTQVEQLFVIPGLDEFSQTRRLHVDPAELIMQSFRHCYDALQGVQHIIQAEETREIDMGESGVESRALAYLCSYIVPLYWTKNMQTLEDATLGTRLRVVCHEDAPAIVKEGRRPRLLPEVTATVNRRGFRTLLTPTDHSFSLYGGHWQSMRYIIRPFDQAGEPLVTLTTLEGSRS